MKIAVWHNLPSGGGKRALYDQLRGLIARGHEVEAWCPPTADRSYLPLSDLMQETVVPLSIKSYSKSPPTVLQNLHPLRWSSRARLSAMDRHCRECIRQIESRGFDLLFAGTCMFFHTPPLARFTKIPSVIYLQEPNRPFYEAMPELPWVATSWRRQDLSDPHFWKKVLMRKLKFPGIRIRAREERTNTAAFDRVLVNSFFSRESLLRAFNLDSKVCYLGIDTDRFVDQHKDREPLALCLASLTPNKNLDFLVLSLAKVPAARRPHLIFIANIVSGAYLEQLRNLADHSGVRFELKQRVDDAELVDLLNRARMMLYAPRLEPFGLAPLEANACGLPVIAVAEGGVRETIQDGINGLLVDHEPESMADAIDRLATDDILHQRLSQNAIQVVRTKWSLQSSVERLERRLKAELRN
jgi:glycosyltransferase involved in cell wall biosynthesis